MDADELLVRLATVHSIASEYIDLDMEVDTAKDSDVEKWTVPFTLYDAKLDYDQSVKPIGGQVVPIKIIRYGTLLRCSRPTVDFFDPEFKRIASGSVGLFYLTQEAAQAEIDRVVKIYQRERAKKELNTLINRYLPYLLDTVDIDKLSDRLKNFDSK